MRHNVFTAAYGELAEIPALPLAKYADDAAWGDVVSSSSFLPRVQLMGGNSEMAKEGLIGLGNYALVQDKKNFTDLGKQFDCIAFSYRFKAMRIPGDGTVLSYFNPKSSEFVRIQDDAEKADSGCMYGPEFLVWLPAYKQFATFFFSSKTARRASPNLRVLMDEKRWATCKTELIKKGKNSWHGPVITPCSTPHELPAGEKLLAVAERFANPKDSEVEVAERPPPDARPQ